MSLEDSAEWIAGCEESLLGISLTCSIVDECDKSSANCECLDVINGYKGSNGIVLLACKINTIREIMTKKNDKMAFLTVEDNTSILDSVVCFPEKWAKFQNLCTENNTIMISGSIGKQKNSLIVEKIWQLSP
jgi:DNA polymerase-3 subunit alpha